MAVPQVALAPGYAVSRLIKGGWQTIGRGPEAVEDLLAFAKAGITAFETSDSYAGGEALMGAFLAAARQRLAGGLARAIKVHTRYTAPVRGNPPTRREIVAAVDRSLSRLGVERLDLVQIQWWNLDLPGLVEAGGWLADQRRQGKIDLIGATNLGIAPLASLLDAGVPVATDQVQYSLIDRRADNGLAAFCAERGVRLLTYGPLAGGFLGPRWLGAVDPQSAQDGRYSREYRALIETGGGWARFQALLAALAGVAERTGRSLSVVALRWLIQRGPGAAILFGASSPDRLGETLSAFDFGLSDDDVAAIERAGLDATTADVGALERDPDSALGRAIRAHVA